MHHISHSLHYNAIFREQMKIKYIILHHSISCSADVTYIIVTLHIFQHTLSNAHEYTSLNHM